LGAGSEEVVDCCSDIAFITPFLRSHRYIIKGSLSFMRKKKMTFGHKKKRTDQRMPVQQNLRLEYAYCCLFVCSIG